MAGSRPRGAQSRECRQTKGKAEGEGAGTVQPSVIRVGKIKNHDGLSCESHTMGLSRRTEALKPNTEQFRGPQSSALSSQSLCA